MSEPRRLRDDASMPDGVRSLLAAGRPSSRLPDGARARGARRVARLAAFPLAITGISLWTKMVIASFTVGLVTGIGVVGVVPHWRAAEAEGRHEPKQMATSTVLAERTAARAPEEESAPVPSAAPSAIKALSPNASAPPARPERVTAEVSVPASAGPTPTFEPPVPPRDTMVFELEWLEAARAAMPDEPEKALLHIERHATLYPAGKLQIEREILRLEALSALGRHSEARERARALLDGDSRGIYAGRLQRWIAPWK